MIKDGAKTNLHILYHHKRTREQMTHCDTKTTRSDTVNTHIKEEYRHCPYMHCKITQRMMKLWTDKCAPVLRWISGSLGETQGLNGMGMSFLTDTPGEEQRSPVRKRVELPYRWGAPWEQRGIRQPVRRGVEMRMFHTCNKQRGEITQLF